MDFAQAIILGIIQGLTEFLPISSSGHLILAHCLLGQCGQETGLAFDVALHLGTLVAVLAYFWRDFLLIASRVLSAVVRRDFGDQWARIGLWIVIGTIPGVIAGLTLENLANTVFRRPEQVGLLLILVALVMIVAERAATQRRDQETIGLKDAILIGLAQATAIVPGVSRSGATISAGLFLGLRRDSAARFSFLLSTPIIAGAAIKEVPTLLRSGELAGEIPYVLVGVLTSAIVGFLCIAFLLRYLQRNTLGLFIGYRLVVGVIAVVLGFVGFWSGRA